MGGGPDHAWPQCGQPLFDDRRSLLWSAGCTGRTGRHALRPSGRGMGAVSAGLIAGTGIKLISALRSNPMRMPVCIAFAALSFAGVALLRLPLAWVLLGTGALGCGWAWVQLARQAGEHA